jgi:hypothetical protein
MPEELHGDGHAVCCTSGMKQAIRYLLRAMRTQARTILADWRRKLQNSPETSVYEEIGAGALIGWGACIVLSWNFPPLVVAVFALCGLCSGAVIGLLLWIGSAQLPEERIAPPPERERRPAKTYFRDDRQGPADH